MKLTAFLLAILMLTAIFTGMFPISAAATAGLLIGDVDKDGGLTVKTPAPESRGKKKK